MGPPYPPSPLPPRGSGFPHESMLPPGARGLQGSGLPALLLDFFLTSSPTSRGPEARGPGFTLCFPEVRARLSGPRCPGIRPASPCFQGTGDHAFRLLPNSPPGLQAFRLSGGHAFRRPCFQEALLPGGQAPPCFPRTGARGPEARSQGPDFQPPCFQGTGDRGPGFAYIK